MKVRVSLLRQRGRRHSNRADESVQGELLLHSIMSGHEMHMVAELRITDTRGSKVQDVLPPLYEPELVAIGSDAFLLRGFESADGIGYVQEWRCELGQ